MQKQKKIEEFPNLYFLVVEISHNFFKIKCVLYCLCVPCIDQKDK